MKPRLVPALLMFISSYFPLVPIFIIKDLDISSGIPDHPRLAMGLTALMAIACLLVLIGVRSIKSGVPAKLTRVSNKSADMFTYTIPYMISFYNFNLGDWKTLSCLAVFMTIMFVLCHRTNNFLINPVLALAGYGLYDCQFESGKAEWQGAVLSRDTLRAGDRPKVERIAAFLYLVTDLDTEGEAHGQSRQYRSEETPEN